MSPARPPEGANSLSEGQGRSPKGAHMSSAAVPAAVSPPPQVDFTAAAEDFLRRMLRFSEHPAGGLRLTVTPGGCSGLSSSFSAEPAPRSGEAELRRAGLRLFLPAECVPLLEGATVDFTESPTRSGLHIQQAGQAACGCADAGAAGASMPSEVSVPLSSIRRLVRP